MNKKYYKLMLILKKYNLIILNKKINLYNN